jgi:hypothetical protein
MALARKKATAIALDAEYRDALASSQKRVGAIDVVVNAVANVLGGTLEEHTIDPLRLYVGYGLDSVCKRYREHLDAWAQLETVTLSTF